MAMTLSVSINEKSKEGKSVLAMLRLLAEKETLTVIEEVEDKHMAKLIMEGLKSGNADSGQGDEKTGALKVSFSNKYEKQLDRIADAKTRRQ